MEIKELMKQRISESQQNVEATNIALDMACDIIRDIYEKGSNDLDVMKTFATLVNDPVWCANRQMTFREFLVEKAKREINNKRDI